MKWSRKDDRIAFYGWLESHTDEGDIEAFISRKVIVEKISLTTYNNSAHREELLELPSRLVIPCLPAGKDHRGNVYRITLDGSGLRPDKRNYPHGSLYDNVLSITFPRDSNDSHVSDNTKEFLSTGSGTSRSSAVIPRNSKTTTATTPRDSKMTERGFWKPTYYYVGMRIDERGASKGLYVVFSFYPDFEYEDGERSTKISMEDTDDGRGDSDDRGRARPMGLRHKNRR
ncbi:MAG: hypothetical protein M1813_001580 [Trichoglossum hirsutum]|nr:MAG: hypothetical protein M1813_001580 [Trichoglossum hirsutum]